MKQNYDLPFVDLDPNSSRPLKSAEVILEPKPSNPSSGSGKATLEQKQNLTVEALAHRHN